MSMSIGLSNFSLPPTSKAAVSTPAVEGEVLATSQSGKFSLSTDSSNSGEVQASSSSTDNAGQHVVAPEVSESIMDPTLLLPTDSKGVETVEPRPLTKNEAMWAFLDKMEKQLGVKPQEVLQAFAELDVDSLKAPPEVSAEAFIKNLDLNEDEEHLAKELYGELLAWTSAAALSAELASTGQNADLKVLNPEQYQTKKQIEGLQRLNDQFFMKGSVSKEGIPQAVPDIPGQVKEGAAGTLTADSSPVPKDSLGAKSFEASTDSSQAGVKSTEELVRKMEAQVNRQAEMSQPAVQKAFKSYGDQLAKSRMQVDTAIQGSGSGTPVDGMRPMSSSNMDGALAASEAGSAASPMSLSASGGGEASLSGESEGEMTPSELATPNSGRLEKSEASGFTVKAPQPSKVEMNENIREIIDRAQVMVKNGGGEMKVALRPEGMGEVQLKVNVQNGGVSVEMVTASDETRKILEKGLADLKDSLTSQKLNVEHIKVDSTKESSNQFLESQQEQADKNFQERFLQDFQGQNNFRRMANFGLDSMIQPGSQMDTEAADNVEKKKNSERKLDLVA